MLVPAFDFTEDNAVSCIFLQPTKRLLRIMHTACSQHMRTARHESQPSQLQSTDPDPGHRVEQQGEQLSLRRSSRSGVQISLLDHAPKHSHVFTRDATNVNWGGFAAHSPASAAQPPLQLPRQQPSSNKQVPTRTQSNIHCLAAAGVALCVRQQHRVA